MRALGLREFSTSSDMQRTVKRRMSLTLCGEGGYGYEMNIASPKEKKR